MGKKKYEDALGSFEKALEIDEKDEIVLLNMGKCFMDMDKFTEAIECFETALEIEPEDIEILDNLAIAFLGGGFYDDAIHTYEHVLILYPEHEQAQKAIKIAKHNRKYLWKPLEFEDPFEEMDDD